MEGWVSLGARTNKKVVYETSNKVHNWKDQFVFVEVPDSFSLERSWRKLVQIDYKSPNLSKEEEGLAKAWTSCPKEHATYRDLMSHASLVHAGLCPSVIDIPSEAQFMAINPVPDSLPPIRQAREATSRSAL